MKRVVSLAVVLAVLASLLLAAPAAANTPPNVEVLFNGHPVLSDVEPQIVNGRTFLPFRALFEKVGATVGFDAATRTVTANRFGKEIRLTIGSTTAYVDGRAVALDAAPFIHEGRTMVPVRFVGEALGMQVTWDGESRTVNVIDSSWPRRGGTVSFASWSPPEEKFNPIMSQSLYDAYVYSPIFDGLFYLDNLGFNPRPALARWWEISPDGLTYTFYLRQNVRWHDGEPFTAEDVRYTFEAIMHPDYTGPANIGFDSLVGYEEFHSGQAAHVSGIETPDPYTVRFRLKQTYAPFFYSLGIGILPKHLYCPEGEFSQCSVQVKDIGTARDPYRLAPIGTGPFKWSSYQSGQFYMLDANEDYYLGRPYIDHFLIKVLD